MEKFLPNWYLKTEKELFQREISFRGSSSRWSIGFAEDKLRFLQPTMAKMQHDGCVNAVCWHKSGNIMLSGSDDRKVKIWNTSGNLNNVSLAGTVETDHRSNIFCVGFNMTNEDVVFSCAADGKLISSNIHSRVMSSVLVSSIQIMHMFLQNHHDPHVLFTAEESGYITRVDLRTDTTEIIFRHLDSDRTRPVSLPVKTIAQPFWDSGHTLVVGGGGVVVGEIDLRRVHADQSMSQAFRRVWDPCASPLRRREKQNERSYMNHSSRTGLSASCVSLSNNDSQLLVNYQSDQIYIFDYSSSSSSSAADDGRGFEESKAESYTQLSRRIPSPPLACLGGHFNHDTFLKTAYFFGPRDEYVVAGSDTGALWIWDASSGREPQEKEMTRSSVADPVRVIDVIQADGRTCNGVIPHPYLPVLASYGIDSDVKLWHFQQSDESVSASYVPEHIFKRDNMSKYSSPEFTMGFSHRCLMNQLLETHVKMLYQPSVYTAPIAARKLLYEDSETEDYSSKVGGIRRYREIVAGIRRLDQWKQLHQKKSVGDSVSGVWVPEYPTDWDYAEKHRGPCRENMDEEVWREYRKYVPVTASSSRSVSEEAERIILIAILIRNIMNEAKKEGNSFFKSNLLHEALHTYDRGERYIALLGQMYVLLGACTSAQEPLYKRIAKNEKTVKEKVTNEDELPVPDGSGSRSLKEAIDKTLEQMEEKDQEDQEDRGDKEDSKDTEVKDSLSNEKDEKKETETNQKKEEEQQQGSLEASKCSDVIVEEDGTTGQTDKLKDEEKERIFLEALRHVWYGGEVGQELPETPLIGLLERALLSNAAAVWMQLGEYAIVREKCTRALEIKGTIPNPDNIRIFNCTTVLPPDSKILYRRACACIAMKDPEAAITDLIKALEWNPNDAAIIRKLKEARRAVDELKQIELKKYRKMFL